MRIAVIGAGIFGLHSAIELSKKGFDVVVYEQLDSALKGASYVNQARIHRGYHYPRSSETAIQCIKNYAKFESEFSEAVNDSFTKYYCISSVDSKITAEQYLNFMDEHDLAYKIVPLNNAKTEIKNVDLIVEVPEFSFDSGVIKNTLLKQLANEGVKIHYNHKLVFGSIEGNKKILIFDVKGVDKQFEYDALINATYSNINGINKIFGAALLPLAHELCEMILVNTPGLDDLGITIMDGDFTSVMPFGHSGYSTISNVRRTPHERSNDVYPTFKCNNPNSFCKVDNLKSCLKCSFRPASSFDKMLEFGKNYIPDLANMKFVDSLITVKTILNNVEETDARPTLVYFDDKIPNFISVLSGKVDTVFDVSERIIEHLRNVQF